jgi:hypothetical protein
MWPLPARGTLDVEFTLAGGTPATLELFDLAGRRLEARELGSLEAGRRTMRLEVGHLGAGVYLLRLRQGDQTITGPVAVAP